MNDANDVNYAQSVFDDFFNALIDTFISDVCKLCELVKNVINKMYGRLSTIIEDFSGDIMSTFGYTNSSVNDISCNHNSFYYLRKHTKQIIMRGGNIYTPHYNMPINRTSDDIRKIKRGYKQ